MFKPLGIYIRRRRSWRFPSLDQREAAKEMGISGGYLSAIERGYVPSLEVLIDIILTLGLDPKAVLWMAGMQRFMHRITIHEAQYDYSLMEELLG